LVRNVKAKFFYVGIRVTDLQRSLDFYTRVLGFKVLNRGKIAQTRGETVALQIDDGGFVLELNYYEPGSPYAVPYIPGEGLDHLAFQVDNLDNALAEARAAGHPSILQLTSPEGRWAYIEDPDGLWIELF
jgi:catechol 2,3-dioxygenase-like lactoylglutathione lyase family enzyme